MERLALIEVLDAHGRCLQAVGVDHWPVTVGRALDCDVVLADPHVAAHHLFLDQSPDGTPGLAQRLRVRVGDSRNGVRLRAPGVDQRLAAGASTVVPAGLVCHIGRSVLRVRLADEALAEELPLAPAAGGRLPTLWLLAAGIAVLAWVGLEQWLQNEPGAGWDKYLPALLWAGVGVVLWSALWGLGSKIFQGHFGIAPHLRVVLGFLLASKAADLLLLLLAFALSVPVLSHVRGWVEIGMLAALFAGHCAVLLPGHERTVRRAFASLCLVVLGIDGALSWRHHQRLFDEQFAAALPPPSVRLVGPRQIDALLSEMRTARGTLEKRAKDDEDSDTSLLED